MTRKSTRAPTVARERAAVQDADQSTSRWMFHSFMILALALGLLGLAGCASTPPAMPQLPEGSAAVSGEYRLGSGDRVRLIVFGEEDLSGEFDVDGTGVVSLPLIGQVQASNQTLRQFETLVRDKLLDGYLVNPKVSAEVLNYRPFYIYGEVTTPGEYPYTNGMTVLNAIAVAGGFTYRANSNRALITRGQGAEVEYPINQQVKVLPGDVVRIPERFF